MEDEFYHLTVKGNDLKTYVRRFQELATLCPTMVLDSEKMMEVFIGGLPRSIEGNVTTSKPQTLEEAINIAQRLMDQDLVLLSVILATRALCKSVPKDHQQQCPGKSLHVEGYECSPRPKRSHGKIYIQRLSSFGNPSNGKEVRQEKTKRYPSRATPVARAPYRLAPSEMQELSNQLQELADR
ncbi:hypothetical protein Tco_0204651, partial [Tanacetum coccineum]